MTINFSTAPRYSLFTQQDNVKQHINVNTVKLVRDKHNLKWNIQQICRTPNSANFSFLDYGFLNFILNLLQRSCFINIVELLNTIKSPLLIYLWIYLKRRSCHYEMHLCLLLTTTVKKTYLSYSMCSGLNVSRMLHFNYSCNSQIILNAHAAINSSVYYIGGATSSVTYWTEWKFSRIIDYYTSKHSMKHMTEFSWTTTTVFCETFIWLTYLLMVFLIFFRFEWLWLVKKN